MSAIHCLGVADISLNELVDRGLIFAARQGTDSSSALKSTGRSGAPAAVSTQNLEVSASEQFKAGRYDLLSTTFEEFERKIRDQLTRILTPGGFDPARDIKAITVNRWPHGYAYGYETASRFSPINGHQTGVPGKRGVLDSGGFRSPIPTQRRTR